MFNLGLDSPVAIRVLSAYVGAIALLTLLLSLAG